jgi:hypothetical protein
MGFNSAFTGLSVSFIQLNISDTNDTSAQQKTETLSAEYLTLSIKCKIFIRMSIILSKIFKVDVVFIWNFYREHTQLPVYNSFPSDLSNNLGQLLLVIILDELLLIITNWC